MAEKLLMTREGYQNLKDELENLKTVKRMEIADKIRVVRGFGDLSENSEYDEAKNEQAILEAKIQKIEEKLKHVTIIEADQVNASVVSIGTKVVLLDTEFGDEMQYRVVSAAESDDGDDAITNESPVGKAIMGRKEGDEVVVKVPAGELKFKILKISI